MNSPPITPPQPSISLRTALVLLLLPPLFWAGNAIVGRLAVVAIPPLALSFWRWALAFLLLLPWIWRELYQSHTQIRLHFRELIGLSALGVGAYNSLQYLALTTTSPINVTLISSALPIFILPLAVLLLNERPTRFGLIGIVLSLLGVISVMTHGELQRLRDLQLAKGDLLMLLAGLSWATYSVWLRRKRSTLSPLLFLAVQIGLGTLLIAPFYAWEAQHTGPFVLTWRTIATISYVAVLPSLVAYYVWDRGVAIAGPSIAALYVNLTPIYAALLSVILLHEAFRWYHATGLILVIAGMLITQRKSNA